MVKACSQILYVKRKDSLSDYTRIKNSVHQS